MIKRNIERYEYLLRQFYCLDRRREYLEAKMLTAQQIRDVVVQSSSGQGGIADLAVEIAEIKIQMRDNLHETIELRQILKKAIEQLPECEIRLILEMRILEGVSYSDMAKTLNYERSTVFKKYKRGLTELSLKSQL